MFWHELPNYNPQSIQSLELGFQHSSDAAGLFGALIDEDLDPTEFADREEGDPNCQGGPGSPAGDLDEESILVRPSSL